MSFHRTLLWFAAALVSSAASEPAVALGGSQALMTSHPAHSFLVKIEGRKGTRNYVSDDYEAATKPEDGADTSTKAAETQEQRLRACMETWDTKTHISKDHWRKICERMLSE